MWSKLLRHPTVPPRSCPILFQSAIPQAVPSYFITLSGYLPSYFFDVLSMLVTIAPFNPVFFLLWLSQTIFVTFIGFRSSASLVECRLVDLPFECFHQS